MTGKTTSRASLIALLCLTAAPALANTNAGADGVEILHPGVAVQPATAAEPGGIDEGPLWRLYDAGNYGAVRRAIARLHETDPAWRPPAKLLDLMTGNEARDRLRAARRDRKWREVVAIAGSPDCARVETLWDAAEAHARLGALKTAERLYRLGATSCTDPAERIATLQKAAAILPADRLPVLYEAARTAAPSPAVRGRIDKLRPREAATASKPLDETKMRGWTLFRLGRPDEAVMAFRQLLAMPAAPDIKKEAATGLALGLQKIGQMAEAAEVARLWHLDDSPALEADAMRSLALDAYARKNYAATLEALARRRALSPDRHDLDAVEGWSHFHLHRYGEAEAAFRRLDQRFPSPETKDALRVIQASRFNQWD
ncbi:MAG TPA: hypothetical protein VEB64_11485 [Azospirillaceae bacterium]|nr:hypothetical protein [Azospirillaceae bacterium]